VAGKVPKADVLTSDKQSSEEIPIKRIVEHVVYRNRFITVYDDPVIFNNGAQGTYVKIVESDGLPGVAALPLAGDQVGLVRTYRYALGAWEWGIPRGFAHGGDPKESAKIELVEEIGIEPQELIPLGQISPNSSLLASVVSLFIARYSSPVITSLIDTFEIADVRWLPTVELLSEIAAGTITDGFTLAAVCSASCRSLI
jgi:8-oxo-dGTP pyrophosphatase MutT (NUDIX family)